MNPSLVQIKTNQKFHFKNFNSHQLMQDRSDPHAAVLLQRHQLLAANFANIRRAALTRVNEQKVLLFRARCEVDAGVLGQILHGIHDVFLLLIR
jgi:hypothetical protein